MKSPLTNVLLSEALETPVSTLFGEAVIESEADSLKVISEKLKIINLQLARRKAMRQKILHWMLIFLFAATAAIFAALVKLNSPYFGWDYSDPETAVFGAVFHTFEWLFVRMAPVILIGAAGGILLTRKKV